MSARRCTRTAVTLPDASAASSMSWIWPRPCTVAWLFSLRSSIQRTGRFNRFASASARTSSAYTLSFEPNPPPTAGAIDAQLLLGHAHRDREHDLEDVGDLRRRVDRVLLGERLRHHAHAAALHRHRNEPLLHVPFLDRVRGVRERVVDGLRIGHQRPRVGRVRAEVVVDDDTIGERILELDDRGQRVVVDDHFVGGVARFVRAVRDDDCHRVADVAGLVDRDRAVVGVLDVVGDRPRQRHRLGPVVDEVGAGEHRDDAGHRGRGLGVDRADAGVRVRAAHDLEVQRARDVEVGDVLRFAGEERRVFLAQHSAAHDRAHRATPAVVRASAAASTAFTMFW